MANYTKKSRSKRGVFHTLGILGLFSCLSLSSMPGLPASGPQTGGVTVRVDVELVTVEVMVFDKKGHPVRNLTREDFQLLEDGKRQEIVTFAEISDDSKSQAPTSLADADDSGLMPGKVVLIFFDDSHITSSQLILARQSAEKYVKEQMRPMDLFGVASYGMSLKILQNFTHDAAKVVEAIRQPATSFATPSREFAEMSEPGMTDPSRTTSRRDSKSSVQTQEARWRVANLFRAINGLNATVAPIKGKKVVLLYSEDFSASPDVQTDYDYAVNSAKRANVAFYTIDVRGLNAAPIGGVLELREGPGNRQSGDSARNNPSVGRTSLERLRAPSALGGFGMLAPLANSMVQQSGGGQTGGGQGTRNPPSTGGGSSGGGSSTPGGSAGRGGSTPGASTAPGSGTNTYGNTDRNASRNDQPDFSRFDQQRLQNMLRSLASETGGVAIFNTSDFNGRLNDVSQGLNNYYVLGFQSNNPKRDGKFRRLEVKSDVKGAEIRHREGYVDPRPLDVLAGSKGEKAILSAISSPSAAAQLPVVFRAGYFYESPGLARIAVAARISTSSVELKNKGGQLAGELNIMGIALGEDGGIVSRFSETMPLLMEKDKEASFRQQDLRYKNHFKLRPGKYLLKFAIADTKGKVGSAEQSLIVPPVVQGNLTASSLILAEKANRLPPLIQDLQVKLLDESDPMIFKGLQIVPSVDYLVPASAAVSVIFKLYNLSGEAEQRNLVARVKLTNEKGESKILPPIALNDHFSPTGKAEGVVGINLPFKDIPPGKYRLAIATSEASSNRDVTLETDLRFK